VQFSQRCMLEPLVSWLARCMHSSHGTFTEVLRIPLSRREEEEVEAGFSVDVSGGAILLVFLEFRTRSVTGIFEALLGVKDASVRLSVNFKAS
jgi:hypothetical protein